MSKTFSILADMIGRPFRIVLLLLLVVVVSSCHKNQYSTFSMKPAKVKNWKHPGHQWKKRHGRPPIRRSNGYWSGHEQGNNFSN